MTVRRLSPAEIAHAQALFADGITPLAIAQQLGISYNSVRYHCDPAWRAKVSARQAARRADIAEMSASRMAAETGDAGHPVEPPPPETLSDWRRRLSLVPASLTAAYMNDPLPGYSALDRRDR